MDKLQLIRNILDDKFDVVAEQIAAFNTQIQKEVAENFSKQMHTGFSEPRCTNIQNLGPALDTKRLYVKITSHKQNDDHKKGGIIWYTHPTARNKDAIDYWVTPNKFDYTLWDELQDNHYYFIKTQKHKIGRQVVWIWVAYKEVGYFHTLPPISNWQDNWEAEYQY
jgi:hypothetical protein